MPAAALALCAERRRLMDGLISTTRAYARAADEFAAAVSVLVPSNVAVLKANVAAARRSLESVRNEVTQHRREHGC